MSVFAWLDHDEAAQRRMREVIELFRERDTVDELGIGSVRDAFSNLLFPGTSVLHSRARYLLFVPWIYVDLERKKVTSAEATARARHAEVRLIHSLIAGGEGDGEGVIGAQARERLKLLPSYAYWNGLRVLGIRQFPGSVDRYHRSLDAWYALDAGSPRAEGGEAVEGSRRNWHAGLPAAPEGLLESATFALGADEASYLRERIRAAAPESALDFFTSCATPTEATRFPWQHPEAARLPANARHTLGLARVFSEVMHGAALLYNLMLAELAGSAERRDDYESALASWNADLRIPEDWSWDEFWAVAVIANPNISRPTREFVQRWFAVSAGDAVAVSSVARAVISDRELMTKRGQARLHNPRALELWGGTSGTSQLAYRWGVVERIVNDIVVGTGE